MNVAVATCNSATALTAMLGSLQEKHYISLSICDSSDAPVIQDPQFGRMLGLFNRVSYKFIYERGPLVQKLCALEAFPPHQYAFVLDDDLLLKHALSDVFTHCHGHGGVIFGQKVDAFNDKGYPDFAPYTLQLRTHSFYQGPGVGIRLSTFEDGRPDPGFMCGPVGTLLAAYHAVKTRSTETPDLQDDVAAYLLATPSFYIHTEMQAWHVGNASRRWDVGRTARGMNLYNQLKDQWLTSSGSPSA